MKITKTKDILQPIKLYNYYIAIDWSIEGATIARMKSNSIKPIVKNIDSNIKSINEYLKALPGTKILTIEETTGAQAALGGKNDIREYYEYLLQTKKYTEKNARNRITRYIATSVYAVMKNKKKYEPYCWRKRLENKAA